MGEFVRGVQYIDLLGIKSAFMMIILVPLIFLNADRPVDEGIRTGALENFGTLRGAGPLRWHVGYDERAASGRGVSDLDSGMTDMTERTYRT